MNYSITAIRNFPSYLTNKYFNSLVGLPGRMKNGINSLFHFNLRPTGVRGKFSATLVLLLIIMANQTAYSGWTTLNSGTTNDIWAMDFLNANTGYYAGANILRMTTNGGVNWTNSSLPGFQTLRGIIMHVGGNVQGVTAGHGGAWRTTNSGSIWFNTFAAGTYFAMGINWANQNIYCAGSGMTYAKTSNWGAAWTTGTFSVAGTVGFDIYSLYAHYTGLQPIYICGSSANNGGINTPKLCRSTDGGATFSIVVNFPAGVFTGASLNDVKIYNNMIFSCASNGRVIRSTNSGVSFDTANLGSYDLRQISFKNTDTAFICSSGGQVFMTPNRGANWYNYGPTGTANNLRTIEYISDYLYSAGAGGTLIKKWLRPNQVTVSGAVTVNGNYETLSEAFTAINGVAQTGSNITVTINSNTAEPATGALLNNGAWSSLRIQPYVGSAITISGTIADGDALIDLNGADNVTIDGVNTGGASLIFSNLSFSSVSGTSTIKLRNDAVNNKITNCKIYGSSRTDFTNPCATVLFDAEAVSTGNDNNSISNCDIGPAGSNLPYCGVYFNGSTGSSALNNSNNTILNCNIYDYHNSIGSSVGMMVSSGNTSISVIGNKFYQTATRANNSSGSNFHCILINNTSGDNFRINENIIGYNNSGGTGDYTLNSSINGPNFFGINVSAGTTLQTEIKNNIISNILLSGNWNSATLINVTQGNVTADSNTIGSLSGNSITFNSLSSSFAQHLTCIKLFGAGNKSASGNLISGIRAIAPSCDFLGIFFNNSSGTANNISNNFIGGNDYGSLDNGATSNGIKTYGIFAEGLGTNASIISGNIIKNIKADNTWNSFFNSGISGIYVWLPTGTFTVSNNLIHSIVSTTTSIAKVSGLEIYAGTGNANGNFIHSLSVASNSSVINGINTFAAYCNYSNNMISLGKFSSDSVETNGCPVYGIYDWNTGSNYHHNSIYITGNPETGNANSFGISFLNLGLPTNLLNNIFYNSRSNNGSTGKHYSISLPGTSPNPAGLSCNYNDLYVNGNGGMLGFFNSSDVPDMPAWKTLTGKDTNSISANPKFFSSTNLHIDSTTTSVLNASGIPIAGVTTDYDNNAREITTPDIGADEFNQSISGKALSLDGVNDYVSLPNSLTQNFTSPSVSEITIEYWFKGSNVQSAVRFQVNSSTYIVAGWGSTIGNQKHLISSDGGLTGIPVGANVTDGSWHHVAMTWKKNTVNGFRSYLDGVLVSQRNSANVDLPSLNVPAYLGCEYGTSEFMNGSLDEVRIWTRALGQTEIATNMYHEIDSANALLASYHFNHGVAGGNNTGVSSLSDFAGNYDGTLTNFSLNGSLSNWIEPGPGFCTPYIEVNIQGNSITISDGDVTPSVSDNTDFGSVSADSVSVKTFTIQNTGLDSLNTGKIFFTGSDSSSFSASVITPTGKIPPGSSASFTITFTPASSGIKSAAVRIPNNDCDEYDYDFAVTGTGVAAPAQVLNFDGINDNVILPESLSQNLTAPTVSEITIEYWFKGTYVQSAVRFQTTGSNWIVAGWQQGSPGNPMHLISTEGGTAGISVGAAVTDGNWHHVAMTWKKNTINGFKSYLDGVLIEQRNSSNSDLPNISVSGYLGRYNAGSGEYTLGSLDEVRIWTRELSQSEISANMFLEINSGAGLLASYHFNQGFAGDDNSGVTTLTDATSNYPGTLTNFALNGITSNWVAPGPSLIPATNIINITAIHQGYYNAGSNQQSLSDTMRAYLCLDVSPFNAVDSAVGIIDSITHSGTFEFSNVQSGNYYIKLIHRNCIETWSTTPQNIGDTTSYDFTSAAVQAFGNNVTQVDASPVRFAIYCGDVNQDGVVDGTDGVLIDNDAANFNTGYLATDLNGDNVIDGSDAVISDNNAANFVSAVVP